MNISDHFPIFMSLVDTSKPELEQEEETTRRVVNTETINNCIANLQNICWDNVLGNTDLNNAYDIFICKLNHAINENMPLKKLKLNKKKMNKPWLTRDLLNQICEKNEMYKNGDATIAEEYRKKKNKLTNLLRISEKNYYKQLLDNNKNNLSKLWKSLNLIISRKENPE